MAMRLHFRPRPMPAWDELTDGTDDAALLAALDDAHQAWAAARRAARAGRP